MISTYSDLKTAVANYLGRTDLTAQIPDFISFAELRMSRDLRIRQMMATSTLTTVGGTATVTLPSNFLQARDTFVAGDPRSPISYMSPAVFSRDALTEQTGKPTKYTLYGSTMELAPVPDAAYDIKVLYYFKPTPLSDSNTTNEFLANCPDALLFASLSEAEPYLMNDARLQTWAALYDRAIANITTSDDSAEYSGVPLQIQNTSR
jgi:hypothetical protein